MTFAHHNLLDEPPPVLLPGDPEAEAALEGGESPWEVAAAHPAASAAWAALADDAWVRIDDGPAEASRAAAVECYAYARTGYHRGLDALRRAGWKGYGPVPWSHPGNRGFLRCLTLLAKAAEEIGETDEQERCTALMRDCDPTLAL